MRGPRTMRPEQQESRRRNLQGRLQARTFGKAGALNARVWSRLTLAAKGRTLILTGMLTHSHSSVLDGSGVVVGAAEVKTSKVKEEASLWMFTNLLSDTCIECHIKITTAISPYPFRRLSSRLSFLSALLWCLFGKETSLTPAEGNKFVVHPWVCVQVCSCSSWKVFASNFYGQKESSRQKASTEVFAAIAWPSPTIATIEGSTRTAKVKKRQDSERRTKNLLREACRGKLGFRLNQHAANVDTQLFLAIQLGVLSGLPGSFVYGSSGTVYGARCHGIVDMAPVRCSYCWKIHILALYELRMRRIRPSRPFYVRCVYALLLFSFAFKKRPSAVCIFSRDFSKMCDCSFYLTCNCSLIFVPSLF